MEEEKPKHAGGRPATGVTPKRNVRIGQVWDDAAGIAAAKGMTMTAYLEELLDAAVASERRRAKKVAG